MDVSLGHTSMILLSRIFLLTGKIVSHFFHPYLRHHLAEKSCYVKDNILNFLKMTRKCRFLCIMCHEGCFVGIFQVIVGDMRTIGPEMD